ncbi:uncharacterized protein LOC125061496 [Pieris napi]|uniref:uncharacterized protein LOC125061496 n=1 Tax=Pieris napi TaxID=78633 RepID=UPI001FB8782C|nr:uncharacterized protein LOC125061496 [Pieris napi]
MLRHITLLILNVLSVYSKPDVLMTEHLKFAKVRAVCSKVDVICKSNSSNVCAVRLTQEIMDYRDFENTCFLYMTNMCDNPAQEYAIVVSGSCSEFLNIRRSNVINAPIVKKAERNSTIKFQFNTTQQRKGFKHLRAHPETTWSTLYDIETAFDYHLCPMSCPNTYDPVCVAVNRGHGLYFKFYTFVNHCAGDLYYCKHWEEFSPPPDEGELVKSSPLSWSYCASNKYIQYARFSEVTSSMGYYGWLAGDYKYSHIMEPHERIPGHG